jgi:hypothetical protein
MNDNVSIQTKNETLFYGQVRSEYESEKPNGQSVRRKSVRREENDR